MPEPGAVAVTGIGAVCACGGDVGSFRSALLEGQSGITRLPGAENALSGPASVGAVPLLPPPASRRDRRLSRTERLGIAAAREAFAPARDGRPDWRSCSIVAATTVAGLSDIEPALVADPSRYYRAGRLRLVGSFPFGHLAGAIGDALGTEGPRTGMTVACASGAIAIATAARMILDGRVPLALAGGSDALSNFTLAGFNALQALDPEPCRPFDTARNGLNIGEGAGFLLLEDIRSARARGARIHATLVGWAMTNDAFHPTAPDDQGRGLAECVTAALDRGGVDVNRIGYLNAHGTGTQLNDVAEVRAYDLALGARESPVPVSSTKAHTGHTLAAAGAIEAIAAILALDTGCVFPTLRLSDPIEARCVEWVRGAARSRPIEVAVSVSAGFGGSNAALVFERPHGG